MVFDQKAFGLRIRRLRNERKLKQWQLAEIVNVGEEHIRHIEAGTRCGSIDLICDLSEFFGVSIDYLIKGKSNQDIDEIKEKILTEIEELSTLIRQL